jgi:hypothetical protein
LLPPAAPFLHSNPAAVHAPSASADAPADVPAPPAAAPAGPPGRRLFFFLVSLGLVAVSGLIALGVGELAVRVVAPQQLVVMRPDIWQPADSLGWAHRPGVATTINTGERTVAFRTDRDGYRVGAAGRREAPRRLLLLGDSFMEALQVDHEQSLAGRLEVTLPARVGEPVVVRNAGVSAWDPPHYLMQARRAFARERFDAVLVSLYLGNDIVDRSATYFAPRRFAERHDFRFPRSLGRQELVDALLYPVNDALETRSHLYILLKNAARGLRMRLGLSADYVPTEILVSEARSPRWDVTAAVCRQIAEESRRHGLEPLFVLIPGNYEVDDAILQRYVRGFAIAEASIDVAQPGRLLGAALDRQGLDWVDARPALQQALASGRKLYGTVDPHFASDGHAVVSALVDSLLAERMRASSETVGPTPQVSGARATRAARPNS